MKRRKIVPLLGLLLTALMLTACQPQPVATYYKGYRAEPNNVIRLDGAAPEGRWATFALAIDYRLARRGASLDVGGSARHGLYYEMNTIRIISLDLYLHFLDKDARVLETALLSRVLNASPEEEISFRRNLTIPAGATAFTFGYQGRAQQESDGSDSGPGAGRVEYYDELPKRN